jgi:hypothetical protein
VKSATVRKLATALTVAATVAAATAAADANTGHAGPRPWFTSWSQSQQRLAPSVLADRSVRMITN